MVSLSSDCSTVSDPDMGLSLNGELTPPVLTSLYIISALLPLSASVAETLKTSVPRFTF